MPGEEYPVRSEEAAKSIDDLPPRRVGQIDKDVSAEDDVVGRLPGEETVVDQIFAGEMNGLNDGFSHSPFPRGAAEKRLLRGSQGLPERPLAINGSTGGGKRFAANVHRIQMNA